MLPLLLLDNLLEFPRKCSGTAGRGPIDRSLSYILRVGPNQSPLELRGQRGKSGLSILFRGPTSLDIQTPVLTKFVQLNHLLQSHLPFPLSPTSTTVLNPQSINPQSSCIVDQFRCHGNQLLMRAWHQLISRLLLTELEQDGFW